jgi:hypothetical protein
MEKTNKIFYNGLYVCYSLQGEKEIHLLRPRAKRLLFAGKEIFKKNKKLKQEIKKCRK